MRICPKRDAVCPHGIGCSFTTDQYECRDGRSDIRSRLEECQLSMATRGQLDGSLSPHLWEQLRQRLQKIYRKATGEPMAVLSVDDASPSPISAGAVVEACAKTVEFANRMFQLHGFMLLHGGDEHMVTIRFPDLKEAQQFHDALVELSTYKTEAAIRSALVDPEGGV